MEDFLGIVNSCWSLLDKGVEFCFNHPYVLIGAGLGVISRIISTGKRAVSVSKK